MRLQIAMAFTGSLLLTLACGEILFPVREPRGTASDASPPGLSLRWHTWYRLDTVELELADPQIALAGSAMGGGRPVLP